MEKKTKAIILKTLPYDESDLIVKFFSEKFGLINGLAKGAKRSQRRFPGTLALFSIVEFLVRKRESLYLLKEASQIFVPQNVTKDLKSFYSLTFASELISRLIGENEPQREIFHILSSFIKLLDKNFLFSYLLIFEILFLKYAGYIPDFERCVGCKSKENLFYFSPSLGGVLCNLCKDRDRFFVPISKGALESVKFVKKIGEKAFYRVSFGSEIEAELFRIFNEFLEYHFGSFTSKNMLMEFL